MAEEHMNQKRWGSKKSSTIMIILIFLFLQLIPILSMQPLKADQSFSKTYTLTFQDPYFSTRTMNNTTYVTVSIKDCVLTSEPGAAQLPFYATHMLIPEGFQIQEITISEKQSCDYSNMIKDKDILFAEQETRFGSSKEKHMFEKNQSWYALHSYQPAKEFEELGISYMKGYPIQTIHVYPLRYQPADRSLLFHKQLKITVTFTPKDSSLDSNRFLRKHTNDVTKVKDFVLNPALVDMYLGEGSQDDGTLVQSDGRIQESTIAEAYPNGLCNASQRIDYVIVTSETLAESSIEQYNWTDLLTHRQQDGLSTRMVTMEEILSCSDYYNDTTCFNDSAARLREFCIDAYLDWNTEYILLGGGWVLNDQSKQIVPCRIFTDLDELGNINAMPSDLYFSNLDGDWYYDTNVWGGGRGGANDKLSELCIGRIPVWNAEMVSNAVSKIIWYDNCNNVSFLRSAGFLGGDLGWTATSKQYMEELRIGDGSFEQFEGFEEWNTAFPAYQIDTTARYYDADYSSETEAINTWKTAINNNEMCLISHLDHGSETNTLSLLDGSTLSNDHYFLGTSQACSSGRYTNGESGASSFLGNWADRGAFAMILNTGYGYGSSTSTAGKSQLQHKILWDYFFANQTTDFSNWQLGSAMQYTKDILSSYIDSISSHVYAYVWYSWNLFGDPAQQIRLNENINHAPDLSNSSPIDNSINIACNQSILSINITDEDDDLLEWTIETIPHIGNSSGENGLDGKKTCSISNLSFYTEYTWFVNVTDGTVWTNASYTFTTETDPTNHYPISSTPIPQNNTTQVDVETKNVSIKIQDSDGDNLTYTIEGNFLTNKEGYGTPNSTVNASVLTPLPFNSTLTWYVTVSDNRSYPITTNFVFTTRPQHIPTAPHHVLGSSMNRTIVSLNWTKNTSSDTTIIERNTIPSWNQNEGTLVYNATSNSIVDTKLLPGITYYYQLWGFNTTDRIYSNTSTIINITTIENNPVIISSPHPINNSENCSLNLTFSINLTDNDGDDINWTIQSNTIQNSSATHDINGTKTLQLTNLSYYTKYTIWVNATDGYDQISKSFQFTTKLPNDTTPPEITSIVFSTSELIDGRDAYGWNDFTCTIVDDFRVASATIQITEDNSVTNLTLNNNKDSDTWTTTFNNPLHTPQTLTLFTTDLNGNPNQTTMSIPTIFSSLNFETNHNSIDYMNVPIDISSIAYTLQTSDNDSLNYSFTSTPHIGRKQGLLFTNQTINTTISSVSYDTTYECSIILNNTNASFVLDLHFTTEDEQDTSNTHPPAFPVGGGGGFLSPLESEPEEEDQNLPPEIPLPPSGSSQIQKNEQFIVNVSSWDQNHDLIRFQIDWNDSTMSNWSLFVLSNESVHFSHKFKKPGSYAITVKAQDEHGLNSSWSNPFTVTVQSSVNDLNSTNTSIIAHVNNLTGEAKFSYELNTSSATRILWDFGDGAVVEGSSPIHRYAEPGIYNVTVTITDENGIISSNTYSVTIPEPQQEVDTVIALSKEHVQSLPWIFILIGIISSMILTLVLIRFRE